MGSDHLPLIGGMSEPRARSGKEATGLSGCWKHSMRMLHREWDRSYGIPPAGTYPLASGFSCSESTVLLPGPLLASSEGALKSQALHLDLGLPLIFPTRNKLLVDGTPSAVSLLLDGKRDAIHNALFVGLGFVFLLLRWLSFEEETE